MTDEKLNSAERWDLLREFLLKYNSGWGYPPNGSIVFVDQNVYKGECDGIGCSYIGNWHVDSHDRFVTLGFAGDRKYRSFDFGCSVQIDHRNGKKFNNCDLLFYEKEKFKQGSPFEDRGYFLLFGYVP